MASIFIPAHQDFSPSLEFEQWNVNSHLERSFFHRNLALHLFRENNLYLHHLHQSHHSSLFTNITHSFTDSHHSVLWLFYTNFIGLCWCSLMRDLSGKVKVGFWGSPLEVINPQGKNWPQENLETWHGSHVFSPCGSSNAFHISHIPSGLFQRGGFFSYIIYHHDDDHDNKPQEQWQDRRPLSSKNLSFLLGTTLACDKIWDMYIPDTGQHWQKNTRKYKDMHIYPPDRTGLWW